MYPNKQKLSLTIANSLYQGCIEGAVYNSSLETPRWGYLVTIEMGPTYTDATSVNPHGVAKFIERYLGKIHHPIFFFTSHIDKATGMVCFDMAEQCANEEYAVNLAKEKGQLTIWDVQNNERIIVEP